MSKQQQTSASELTEVVLLKNHTHNGEPTKAGKTIRVTADQKKWLSENKIIKG